MRANDPKVDLADLTLLDQDAHLSATWKAGALAWQAHIPALRFRLAPTDIELQNGVHVSSAAAIVQASADSTSGSTSVTLVNGSWLGMQSMHIPKGATPIDVGGLYLQSEAAKNNKSPNFSLHPGGEYSAQVDLRTSTKNPLMIVSGTNRGGLADMAIQATVSHPPQGKTVLQSVVSFDHGSIDTGKGIQLRELACDLPITFNRPGPPRGTFAIKSFLLGSNTITGPAGTWRFADGRLDFTAGWQLFKEAALRTQGWIDDKGLGGTMRADVQAVLPTFRLTDPGEVATIIPARRMLRSRVNSGAMPKSRSIGAF